MTYRAYNRREFLEFMGYGAAGLAAAPGLLPGCTKDESSKPSAASGLPFEPLKPSRDDALRLAEGFDYRVVLRHGQALNVSGAKFGFNNDFIELVPVPGVSGPDDLLIWVNHEYVDPMLLHGKPWQEKLTKEEVDRERLEVGGSFARIRRVDGQWRLVENDPLNRRLDGTTPIPLVAGRAIAGSRVAIGTFANCAGGKTPWGTVLTCEENYDDFYPERDASGERLVGDHPHWWHAHYDYPPEHYGWVVEVNPLTGAAKKLVSLGRFAHECATVRVTRDGRAVVYSGDDMKFGCLYKFIAAKPGSLEEGTLYVANVERGEWITLDRTAQPTLRERFKDQTDVLVHAREAAVLVGGSRLDRPEDIEVDPNTGAVLVALTNNSERGNLHGAIMRLLEKSNDPAALQFSASEFLAGGQPGGITCPDNLTFDARGNLWVTNDVSGKDLDRQEYRSFGHNGLFYIPMRGENAGNVYQVASAPREAELTGPKFSPDGTTLFLSVQHPGEETKIPGKWSSHWPDGGTSKPSPAVVAIQGPALRALTEPTRPA